VKTKRETLLWLGLFLTIGVVVVSAIFPRISHRTNCGGNSAALARVQEYAELARLGAAESTEHAFRVEVVTPEQRQRLAELAHYDWIPVARFLVSTAAISDQESQSKRIIVVCDTPYRNVPQRWIGSAPPTHAAGFSDGSISLISQAEFTALDRSAFKFLDELYPAK
jgi:hypothetical protein